MTRSSPRQGQINVRIVPAALSAEQGSQVFHYMCRWQTMRPIWWSTLAAARRT